MRSRLWGAGVLAVAVLLAGCATKTVTVTTGTKTGAVETGTTSTPATPPTQTPSQLAADRALARRSLLRLGDFPAGWTEGSPVPTKGPDENTVELAKCLHTSTEVIEEKSPVEVESPRFGYATAKIFNKIAVEGSEAIAKEQFGLFAEPQMPACLSKVFSAALAHESTKGVTAGTPVVSRMSFPPYADQSTAFRVQLPVTSKQLHVSLYLDVVIVRSGRTLAEITFQGSILPVATTTEEHLTEITADRMEGKPVAGYAPST